MIYQSHTSPLLRPVQRIVLALTFLFVSPALLYVWMPLFAYRWYGGALSVRFGLLVPPAVWVRALDLET